MYKYLYKFIQEQLLSISSLKYISLFNDQFNNETEERSIPYPAVLVEFLPYEPLFYLNRYSTGTMEVVIHVGSEIITGLEYGDKLQDNSLEHLSLVDDIYKVLDNKSNYDASTGNTNIVAGNLVRTMVDTNASTNASIRVSQITYKCNITDNLPLVDLLSQSGNTLTISYNITGSTS